MTKSSRLLPPGEDHRIDYNNPETLLPLLSDLFTQYGDIAKLKSLEQESWIYVVTHPAMAKQVLASNYKNYRKGVGIDRVNVLLGRGIMVSEGALWKRQRKMLQPMFHKDILTQLVPLMSQCTEHLLEEWQHKISSGDPINITDATSQAALHFILYALFSEDLDRIIAETGQNPFLMVTDESARDLLFARRFRGLSKVIVEIIDRREKERRRPADILSMIMDASEKESGQAMPERQQLDETLTLIIAGHETTASALNWTWYLISQHPEVEQRLIEESQRVFNGKTPVFEDLSQLVYTRQVLEESMRLYPPGWLLTRRALDEDDIGGFYVAPGTDVFVPPFLIHRHPDFWENPEQFNPERFTPEQKAKRPQGAYLAFSIGPRNCIGEAMAMYEMLIHISVLIQNVHLNFAPGQSIELEALVNLRPKHNLYMNPSPR